MFILSACGQRGGVVCGECGSRDVGVRIELRYLCTDHSRQMAPRQDAGKTKFGNTRPLRPLLSVALSSSLTSSSLKFQKKIYA